MSSPHGVACLRRGLLHLLSNQAAGYEGRSMYTMPRTRMTDSHASKKRTAGKQPGKHHALEVLIMQVAPTSHQHAC